MLPNNEFSLTDWSNESELEQIEKWASTHSTAVSKVDVNHAMI